MIIYKYKNVFVAMKEFGIKKLVVIKNVSTSSVLCAKMEVLQNNTIKTKNKNFDFTVFFLIS